MERRTYSSSRFNFDLPYLLDVQVNSFHRFIQHGVLPKERKNEGLQKIFAEVFPITDIKEINRDDFVAVVEPGVDGYREIRLPEPNERFSTTFDRWEAPGVLRVNASTLDADISARYSCISRKLEIIP